MPVTCPPKQPCFEATCCPDDPYTYRADELIVAFIGDYGSGNTDESNVAGYVNVNKDFDLVLTLGDNDYLGNYAVSVQPYYGVPWLSRGKFWPLPGNHDWDLGSGLAPYLAYFSFLGSRYYSKRIGQVEFFMICDGFDTGMTNHEPDGYTAGTINSEGVAVGGSVQWQWFVKQVRDSTARWKVACLHHPPWASGNGHVGQPGVTPNGSNPPLQWPFKQMGIDLVLSGHEHSYERLVVDGLTYIVNGAGGNGLTGFGTPLPTSVQRVSGQFGAVRLSFTEDRIFGQFANPIAVVFDTFTLTKP